MQGDWALSAWQVQVGGSRVSHKHTLGRGLADGAEARDARAAGQPERDKSAGQPRQVAQACVGDAWALPDVEVREVRQRADARQPAV